LKAEKIRYNFLMYKNYFINKYKLTLMNELIGITMRSGGKCGIQD